MLQFDVVTISDKGLVREVNEDAVFSNPCDGCFAVADGIGGGEEGELASRWVCEALSGAGGVEEALAAANSRIIEYAGSMGYQSMGSTAVVLKAAKDGKSCRIAWAGDSRAYRFRKGKLELLTSEHTVAAELGLEKSCLATGANFRDLPLAHILTRAVGIARHLTVDAVACSIENGDRYVLCSDGVHDLLRDADIAALLAASGTAQSAVDAISSAVLERGAIDNYSVVVVDCRLSD